METRLAALQRARQDLEIGRGRYAETDVGAAARDLQTARNRRREAERFTEAADSRRLRRQWRHRARECGGREARAQNAYESMATPEGARLDRQILDTEDRVKTMRQYQENRSIWLREHPAAASQLRAIDHELNPSRDMPEVHQELSRILAPHQGPELRHGAEHAPDLGNIGL